MQERVFYYARVSVVEKDPPYDERDYVFMLPRKCASNSFRTMLKKNQDITFHAPYLTRRALETKHADLPRIGVVRHPIDRLISCWRFNFWLGMLEPEIPRHSTWTEFLKVILDTPDERSDLHFRSYSCDLVVGGRAPDFMLHVEHVAEEWRALCNTLNWKEFSLGALNPTPFKIPSPVVTPWQLVQLSTRYQADAANFGYEILNWRQK